MLTPIIRAKTCRDKCPRYVLTCPLVKAPPFGLYGLYRRPVVGRPVISALQWGQVIVAPRYTVPEKAPVCEGQNQ